MKYILSILFLKGIFATFSSAQDFIYVGDNKYKSTQTWSFNINGVAWGEGKLEAKVARNGSDGILLLQSEVASDRHHIGGDAFVYLSDGARITCKEKNIRDHVDNKAVAIYHLSSDEINKMKSLHITSIRFTIHPTSDGAFNGSKTADNKSGYSDSYIKTNQDIIKLFEQ